MNKVSKKHRKSATYRQIITTLRELAEKTKETDRQMQETDRRMQETDRRMQETDRRMQETDRQMQETDRQISKLGHRFGDLIEHLIAPNLLDKFADLGYTFTRISRNHEIKDAHKQRLAEIDLFLENGEYALAVEVKSLCTRGDVKDHVKRLYTLRRYADERHDSRNYIGAIAAALYDTGAEEEAVASGFFIIQQSGDTVAILIPYSSWKPRAWSPSQLGLDP